MIVLKKYIITFQYISLFDCILKNIIMIIEITKEKTDQLQEIIM